VVKRSIQTDKIGMLEAVAGKSLGSLSICLMTLRSGWEKGIKLEDAKEDLQTLFPKESVHFSSLCNIEGTRSRHANQIN
jgi:hypothetical protein